MANAWGGNTYEIGSFGGTWTVSTQDGVAAFYDTERGAREHVDGVLDARHRGDRWHPYHSTLDKTLPSLVEGSRERREQYRREFNREAVLSSGALRVHPDHVDMLAHDRARELVSA
jgi:hypothetical protein